MILNYLVYFSQGYLLLDIMYYERDELKQEE